MHWLDVRLQVTVSVCITSDCLSFYQFVCLVYVRFLCFFFTILFCVLSLHLLSFVYYWTSQKVQKLKFNDIPFVMHYLNCFIRQPNYFSLHWHVMFYAVAFFNGLLNLLLRNFCRCDLSSCTSSRWTLNSNEYPLCGSASGPKHEHMLCTASIIADSLPWVQNMFFSSKIATVSFHCVIALPFTECRLCVLL